MSEMSEDLKQLIAEEIEHTELHKDDDYKIGPETKVTRGHSRTRMLEVDLNDDELAALEALAELRQLPVSTIARSMLLDAIVETRSAADIIRGIRAELDLLLQKIS